MQEERLYLNVPPVWELHASSDSHAVSPLPHFLGDGTQQIYYVLYQYLSESPQTLMIHKVSHYLKQGSMVGQTSQIKQLGKK